MTALARAVLALLESESGMPPLNAESISQVLWVMGASPEGRPATVEEIEAALGELMRGGKVEALSRFGERRFRAMAQRQVGNG